MSGRKIIKPTVRGETCIVCAAYRRELEREKKRYYALKARMKEAAERTEARRASEAKQGDAVSIQWLRQRVTQLEAGRIAKQKPRVSAEESALRELLAIRLEGEE